MRTPALRQLRVAALAVLLAAGAMSCGQQGPLVLPEQARPIEPANPAAAEPETQDDEQE
jgi:predicted small lipoprotein YifL